MSHVRLTHPSRSTLTFYEAQQDEPQRQAVANITNELGGPRDRKSLVHTETREIERTIRGQVTGLKRKRDSSASNPIQALANYADELESHVDEYQGNPSGGQYTLEDDQLNVSKRAVLESVEWSLTPGRPFQLDYEATVLIGRATFEDRDLDRRNPSVTTSQDPYLTVDGEDLPGMRDYRMRRSVGTEVNAIWNRDSAENNEIIFNEGVQQSITFEGVHSGTLSARRTADSNLRDLLATKNNVPVETRFPGYDLEMYVTAYNSTLEAGRGTDSHRYRIELVEGQRA